MKSILLVDDDLDDQLFFHLVLKDVSSEFHFTNVNSAEEFFKRLEPENNYIPYVIFMDVNLPVKSGIECLQELKANERLKDIPVIIYSTSGDDIMIDEAYKAGALYYVCKPNSLGELDQILRSVLSKELTGIPQPSKEQFVYCMPNGK